MKWKTVNFLNYSVLQHQTTTWHQQPFSFDVLNSNVKIQLYNHNMAYKLGITISILQQKYATSSCVCKYLTDTSRLVFNISSNKKYPICLSFNIKDFWHPPLNLNILNLHFKWYLKYVKLLTLLQIRNQQNMRLKVLG